MLTRAVIRIYCKCGQQLSNQEIYLFDILDRMCQDCYDNFLEITSEFGEY
jgi:hypothetical protein